MSIGENIKSLRRAHGLSQIELGEILGVSDKAVSTWENGLKTPRISTLRKLADYFGVGIEGLLDADLGSTAEPYAPGRSLSLSERPPSANPYFNPPALSAEDERKLSMAYVRANPGYQRKVCALLGIEPLAVREGGDYKTVEMLVYDDPAAAGAPLYAESGYERLTMPEPMVPSGTDFGVRISGHSMEPTIRDGQIAWVRKQETLRDQEIGIFMLGDSAVCKRLSLPPFGGQPKLLSDNPRYPPITGPELDDLRVVGKVLL